MAIEKGLYAAPEGLDDEAEQGAGMELAIEIVNPDMVTLDDGSVEVTWDAPSGGVEYSNEWVSFDDGTFENAIIVDGQGYLGNNFGMPYGVELVWVHSARVWASNAGSTTLAGFAVIGGVPSPTPWRRSECGRHPRGECPSGRKCRPSVRHPRAARRRSPPSSQ